jgi:hypothetical protein
MLNKVVRLDTFVESFSELDNLSDTQAQEKINSLSPELKAVAEKYLGMSHSPKSALEMVRAQEKINNLSPELKAVAEKFLEM